jgi:hypothetical protein
MPTPTPVPDMPEETHHPEGVAEQDHAYRDAVKERIITGAAPQKNSAVVLFANHLGEVGGKLAALSAQGAKWGCGCQVVFGAEAMILVCEGHR